MFFDALGIDWEYEPQGFELSTGEPYLPDFWLPTFSGGMWVEVKPTGGNFTKARQLGIDTDQPVWLAEGVPDARVYVVACPDGPDSVGIPCADQASDDDRMFWAPGYEEDDGAVNPRYYACLGTRYVQAVELARGARFEHGETIDVDGPHLAALAEREERLNGVRERLKRPHVEFCPLPPFRMVGATADEE